MSYTESNVKNAPPLSTLGKPKDPSMIVSQSTAEMLKIKKKRDHVEYTSANLDTLWKISKPLPLNKCSLKINLSFGKNESPGGSINIRQLNMEQTQDANCILLFFQKYNLPPSQNISLQLSLQELLSFSLDSFKMCFHFQNLFPLVWTVSKCAFIFKICFL